MALAPAWGLAFKIISCSLKGGQRGVWGSLEVKESPSLSQLLAKSATPGAQVLSARPVPPRLPIQRVPGVLARVALAAWEEVRREDPPVRGRGGGQGSLRVASSRVGPGPISSGSPYALGLNSSRPEQLLLGLPWPPRG